MDEAERPSPAPKGTLREPAPEARQPVSPDDPVAFFGGPPRAARLPAGTAYTQPVANPPIAAQAAAPPPAAPEAPPPPPAAEPPLAETMRTAEIMPMAEPADSAAEPAEPAASPPPPAAPAGAERGRILAETVVGSILQRLTVEAKRRGGWLTVEDIENLRREFEGKIEALQKVFELSFEEYVKARERASWEQARRYPFDRLIVERFAPLFASDGGPPLADGGLSRRLLPGFFMAMNMLLGHDITEVYQEQCRRLVAKIKEAHGNRLDWMDVYGDEAARTLTNDAVVAMVSHFEDLRRRGNWMVEVINGHLAPPDVGREGPEVETWQLGERGFIRLANALYSDIREKMATETGRLRLTRAYGADTVAALADLLKRLDHALAHGIGLKV